MRTILVSCVVLFVGLGAMAQSDEEMGVVVVCFFDVGQGDAILVDFGEFEMLVDGGRSFTFLDALLAEVDGPLDLLVATHPDADHIGGLDEVLALFDVLEIWTNGASKDTDAYRLFDISARTEDGAELRVVSRGYSIDVAGWSIEVLHPVVGDASNNGSVVLQLTGGNASLLLTGDIEAEAEAELVSAGVLTDIDILKVSHHGSSGSSSSAFLDAVTAEIAVISVGANNQYGHPAQETLDRLCEASEEADIYRTDVHGDIAMVLVPEGAVGVATESDTSAIRCTELGEEEDSSDEGQDMTGNINGSSPVVVINEVEMNPPGTDSGNEWVELYNPGEEAVDLAGWQLSYTGYCDSGEGTCWEAPLAGEIQPKSYYVYCYPRQHLNNSNGWRIHLRNSTAHIVSSTRQGLTDESNDAHTWQRVPDGVEDWQRLTETRGTANG